MKKNVRPGSIWLHKNGKKYKVILISNEHAEKHRKKEYPKTVVYQGEDGKIWSKKINSFLKSRTLVSL